MSPGFMSMLQSAASLNITYIDQVTKGLVKRLTYLGGTQVRIEFACTPCHELFYGKAVADIFII